MKRTILPVFLMCMLAAAGRRETYKPIRYVMAAARRAVEREASKVIVVTCIGFDALKPRIEHGRNFLGERGKNFVVTS